MIEDFNLSLSDLSDIPPALRQELRKEKRPDCLDLQIIAVINAYGETANIDQILVGLYRKFKVIQKRRIVQNKVFHMCKADQIISIKGQKGVYTTRAPK